MPQTVQHSLPHCPQAMEYSVFTGTILTGGLGGQGLLLIFKYFMKILCLFHNQNTTGLPHFPFFMVVGFGCLLFFFEVDLRNQCPFVKYFQSEILQL